MTPEKKVVCEIEWAAETCRNWKTASVIELQEACRYAPGAVVLLTRRMALGLCTPNDDEIPQRDARMVQRSDKKTNPPARGRVER
jgi:hypothetical protein